MEGAPNNNEQAKFEELAAIVNHSKATYIVTFNEQLAAINGWLQKSGLMEQAQQTRLYHLLTGTGQETGPFASFDVSDGEIGIEDFIRELPELRAPIEGFDRRVSREDIINLIHEKGPEDPAVRERIMEWTVQEEKIAHHEGLRCPAIEFDLDRSEIYLALGDTEGALECLNDILLRLSQEGRGADFFDDVEERIRKIESGG